MHTYLDAAYLQFAVDVFSMFTSGRLSWTIVKSAESETGSEASKYNRVRGSLVTASTEGSIMMCLTMSERTSRVLPTLPPRRFWTFSARVLVCSLGKFATLYCGEL